MTTQPISPSPWRDLATGIATGVTREDARTRDGVREFLLLRTGTARWEAYLAHCGAAGHAPLTRAEFQRRVDRREIDCC